MAIAQSKLTSQGQVSVPAAVRRRLGVGPGSTIEWDEQGNEVVVRRSNRFGLDDTRKALGLSRPPRRRSIDQLDEGIRARMRRKHARS
jgi:AbrB family looped-hinge helix DNA binding protein